ncbi:MAG: hypothetical protein D6732_10815, partial [Methanobacteriota archaeon]
LTRLATQKAADTLVSWCLHKFLKDIYTCSIVTYRPNIQRSLPEHLKHIPGKGINFPLKFAARGVGIHWVHYVKNQL